MNKTIMVIGGGLLQAPVINCAKDMGLQVIVTDYNPNTPGMKDAHIPLVMSTKDIEGSVRIARKQNEITPIHGVLTVGTDASMTVAAVASALNLPGIKFEDARAATNKVKMRTRFKERGVPSPKFFSVWSLSDAKRGCKELGFPVVLKPSDNMGARGVMRIDHANQISDAFRFAKNASPSGELIIEEFMEGPELSMDAIIYNGEITFTGIADRIIEMPPHFIETGHNMPSAMSQEIIDEAKEVMSQGIRALGIDTGAAKGDIKVTPHGVMIGELAARLSGGFMSAYTYPLSTGVNLMRAMIEVALGQEPGNLEPIKNRVSIERAILAKPGVVKKITGLERALKVRGVEEIFLNIKEGDRITKPRSNVEKAGNIIVVADSLEEAEAAARECREILSIETTEEPELTMEVIELAARKKFKKACFVCDSCNGKSCPTGVPGMGSVGTGESFRRNIESGKKYKILTRLIHDNMAPDIGARVFGHDISLPVLAAPITGTVTNMCGAMDELEYNRAIARGCLDAGTVAMVGDGASPEKYKIGLQALGENSGRGMVIFKPRADNGEIIKRIEAAQEASVLAVGVDIDAVVFKTMAMKNQAVGPKSFSDLEELRAATSLPFILKGIMNPRDAELAAKAGMDAIVVSNHGGRVLDHMPGSFDVLPEIVSAVGNDMTIMVDGGFRTGVDIIKALALGADLILIGRPMATAAIGKGKEGVAFYINLLAQELKKAMILTGCSSMEDITEEIILEV